MRIYTQAEVDAATKTISGSGELGELLEDNTGQLVIYTGIFRWSDGTYRDEAEPQEEEDEPFHCFGSTE